MPDSYEFSYQHDLDNVIDASDAVLAIGTEKVSTSVLKDRSLTGNDATIHGAMPSSGYFIGRRFTKANEDHLDCDNNSSLNIVDNIVMETLLKIGSSQVTFATILTKSNQYKISRVTTNQISCSFIIDGAWRASEPVNYTENKIIHVIGSYNNITRQIDIIVNGVYSTPVILSGLSTYDITTSITHVYIGTHDGLIRFVDGICYYNSINNTYDKSTLPHRFNTLARLPLYSHNFTQYPNSDTSLTSHFPYTTGIITSGSFNKTDGLKCTSAGQIVFSNSFEFDGSEYITLTIDGVEYSGTTTVTQGTITATIAQGSNDITIDMGTNDVLEDIRIQFREEV